MTSLGFRLEIDEMQCVHLYSDPSGESHFKVMDIELTPEVYAPPAPPEEVSRPIAARRLLFLRVPTGWFGDWHPSPTAQYMVVMNGELEIEVSDGEVRRFSSGDVVFGEDTQGRGHRSRAVGHAPFSATMIQL